MGLFSWSGPHIREEVLAFHQRQIVVDLHVDVLLQSRLFGYDIRKAHEPWIRRQPLFRHADIPRMLAGGYTLAALGLHYWQREKPAGWLEVRKQVAIAKQVVASDSRVSWIDTASDIETAHQQGLLGLTTGMEGAHILNGNLDHLHEAREWGCLYLTLTHFCVNKAATPGMGRGHNTTDGLTPWGKDLIRQLNALQILVDVSHVNPPGVLDACATSSAPVIATHTCAMGVHKNRRGINDQGLQAIADTGGVIGIIFAPIFLTGKLNASTDAMVSQALYLADRVGPQHIALGSDFDGWIPTIPNDMRDCRDLPLLTQKLLDAGFSQPEVSGILGANFLRVLRTVRG